jgi:hypothetical protein
MSDFGALTDHFGILAIVDGAGTLADKLKLVDSTNTPVADSRADANDENNDIAASTFYGAGSLSEASSTFAVVTGGVDTALLQLGEVATAKTITSIEITTSNDGFPQVTVSGTLGTETMDTSILQTFTMPTYTINGRKQAQAIGFTVGVGCKLTGSSLSGTIELAQQEDGLGEPAAHGVSGGTVEVTADFVRVTAAPSWTVTGVGLTETQVPGVSEGQAAYHTASGTAAGTLTRDT